MLDPDPCFNLGGIGTSPELKSGERWCQSLTLIRYARIDNADANRMMDMLRRLARETGSAALLVHHCSKSDKKGDIQRQGCKRHRRCRGCGGEHGGARP